MHRDRNSTAERALGILDMFGDERSTVSAVDVAAELGVASSTAYRYLQSLVTRRFLEEAPGARYRLGLRVLELARVARRAYGVSDVALPIMERLSARFEQAVLLTRRVGSSIVCLERQEPREQHVRISYERGSALPLNAGASALVLLAWLDETRLRTLLAGIHLQRYTPTTTTDLDELIARLAQIRAQGYVVSRGEVDPDVLGVAAPVFDTLGEVQLGISFVVMQNRVAEGRIPDLIEALQEAAGEVAALRAVAG
ncbi:MAG: IclR family transcriptional regulator [Pseudolysinimonas sp.]